MSEQLQPLFKCLDGNTAFTSLRFWLHENETTATRQIRSAIGVWGWESVLSVQHVSADVMPEVPEPRCMLEQMGGYIYIQADYQEVQRAWREWRLFYASPLIKFTPAN